nr:flagellar hook-length control protein FliK [Marinobacterium ramblicola]
MVELSLALFAEQGGGSAQQGSDNALRYRKAVFSLSTENLGKVQIEAKTADRHLSLRIGAENVEVADVLSSQLSVLTDSLAEWGWAVDEIRYEVGGDDLTVPQAVIEHHYLQDSLSRVL